MSALPSEEPARAPSLGARAPLPVLDLDFARAQFPALAGGWVFLDNAGGSQVLASVADRVREYLLTSSVQVGASYEPSRLAAERIAAAQACALLVNAADPSEVVLGPSTTQLLQNLARAFRERIGPGDEIVVTNADHEANVTPWLRLAEERGATVRFWRADPATAGLDLAGLAPLMTARTRLVCFPHVSNVVGTVHPVAEIARFVHQRGALVCVDGVAYAPHRAVDVRAWDVDLYVFSLYKVFGPHQGLLYGRRDLLLDLANVNHVFVPKDALPYKLLPGNLNYELAHGVPAIVEYLEELGRRAVIESDTESDTAPDATARERIEAAFAAIARHEESLTAPLLEYLAGKPGVRLLGDSAPGRAGRIATVAFSVEGRSAAEIPAAIDPFRIGIRYGDFHARRLIEDLGLAERGGIVRISMAHYNTPEEIERLIAALETVL
ncbi:MAG TPA: cysteine desulfurase-like protein [Thermoanaerobaculia bacterium]|jgi:cysteine desulfurase family protein (TIGR01976 family)|nr:cysteine desulfurase-like protein [Thermoanaerobaculia bacterium]